MAAIVLIAATTLVACNDQSDVPPADADGPAAIPVATTAPTVAPTPIRRSDPAREKTDVLDPPSNPEPTVAEPVVESIAVKNGRETALFREVILTARISNVGGSTAPSPIPVEGALDDEEFESIGSIGQIEPGEAVEISLTREVGPGAHVFEFRVGQSSKSINFEVETPDLVIEIRHYRVAENGLIMLQADVANRGPAAATGVQVWGFWNVPGFSGRGGYNDTVGELAPGEKKLVEISMRIPPGTYDFEVLTSSNSPDSNTEDNFSRKRLLISYDWPGLRIEDGGLHLDLPKPPETVYRDGHLEVEFEFSIANRSPIGSGRIWAGLVFQETLEQPSTLPNLFDTLLECENGLTAGCWWSTNWLTVPAGGDRTIMSSLALDPGEYSLVAFVGGHQHPVRRGGENVVDIQINLVPQPEIAIAAGVGARVLGYWSDGTADVEVTATISNHGTHALEGSQIVRIECHGPDGQNDPDCTAEGEVTLGDGFGPGYFKSKLRAQMGQPFAISLAVNGAPSSSISFTAPERILGVNRYTWDCYSARPAYSNRSQTLPLGCGGWTADRVHKWWQDRPVKVWSTGRSEYRQVLNDVLEEFSPLLNLEFEHVAEEKDADLRAYVGLPSSTALEIGQGETCARSGGCGGWSVDGTTGVIYAGLISAWHFESAAAPEQFIKAIAHEVLHAMIGIGHRPTPDALMGEPISRGDAVLIHLNSHPLVIPGMSMEQVRGVIVLNDELLDPAPITPYELIWRTAATFQQAGSARFELTGQLTGDRCRLGPIGPAQYETSGYQHSGSQLARLLTDDHEYWLVDGEYYSWQDGSWTPYLQRHVEIESGWSHQRTDPLALLHAAAAWGGRETFTIAANADGRILLVAPSVPVPDGWDSITNANILIDANTLQISSYQMSRPVSDTCSLRVKAVNGEFGIAVDPPGELT